MSNTNYALAKVLRTLASIASTAGREPNPELVAIYGERACALSALASCKAMAEYAIETIETLTPVKSETNNG